MTARCLLGLKESILYKSRERQRQLGPMKGKRRQRSAKTMTDWTDLTEWTELSRCRSWGCQTIEMRTRGIEISFTKSPTLLKRVWCVGLRFT